MKRTLSATIVLCLAQVFALAQDINPPATATEAKPGTRWWWMGSAVDKENLTRNLEIYAAAGLGSLEITTVYGVQGNDANEIPFLSEQWMEMLKHTEAEAKRLGMAIDMSTGTGWPFGGPDVSVEDAASKLVINEYPVSGGKTVDIEIYPAEEKDRPNAVLNKLMAFPEKGKCIDLTDKVKDNRLTWKAPKGEWRLIAAFCGKTRQRVKRAAPGGEGYVLNHLDPGAVDRYLDKFARAFAASGAPYPHNFFNDSYEVYGGDWTEGLFAQFERRRGYRLEECLPEFLAPERTDTGARIVSDYRETIAELVMESFSNRWTEWANLHGSKTRNQAHGSPGNLIDVYATVDVPECEGFGLSDFGIKGLRKDSLTRPNDSDISMLKYASSAAHVAGKPYTSSETFTWLTEHFRTSLSQCKPDMDLMFLSGVNRMYFHGTTYSPAEAEWPGWKFYATMDMSPTNSIWKDAPAFFDYITRCQGFLQMGRPDNDFLVYLPVYDMWHEQGGRLLMFDIHSMKKRAPRFIRAIDRILDAGYDVDYISDNFIRTLQADGGLLKTSGGAGYKALVVPGARFMPHDVLAKLLELADKGAVIVFLDSYPEDVPGYGSLTERREAFRRVMESIQAYDPRGGQGKILFGTDYAATLEQTGIRAEVMKTAHGISYIRRANEDGHHYFISALKGDDTDAWIPLAVEAESVMIYDPMTGKSGKALTRTNDGNREVYLQLASGQSAILKTFAGHNVKAESWEYLTNTPEAIACDEWELTFPGSVPAIEGTYPMNGLLSWTEADIPGGETVMGTGRYTTRLRLAEEPGPDTEWILDLGDVRESARVRVNGEEAAVLWAVPFRCRIADYLRKGENTIEIEVTNLPANRIADMDRRGIPWRKFKEINIVDIHYKATGYAHWEAVPGGLLGPVRVCKATKAPQATATP